MLGWLRRKSAQTVPLDQISELGGFVRYGTSSGVSVSPATAVQVSAVMCAVKVISEGIAQMPVRVVAERGITGRTGFWPSSRTAGRPALSFVNTS